MSKISKPVMGMPIGDTFCSMELMVAEDMIDIGYEQNNPQFIEAKLREKFIERLESLINTDTCVTKGQKDLISDLAYREAIESKMDVDRALAKLVSIIHSFKLQCNRCLNGQCTRRDPEVPVPEVPEIKGK